MHRWRRKPAEAIRVLAAFAADLQPEALVGCIGRHGLRLLHMQRDLQQNSSPKGLDQPS
jgi:hypothetical protein